MQPPSSSFFHTISHITLRKCLSLPCQGFHWSKEMCMLFFGDKASDEDQTLEHTDIRVFSETLDSLVGRRHSWRWTYQKNRKANYSEERKWSKPIMEKGEMRRWCHDDDAWTRRYCVDGFYVLDIMICLVVLSVYHVVVLLSWICGVVIFCVIMGRLL